MSHCFTLHNIPPGITKSHQISTTFYGLPVSSCVHEFNSPWAITVRGGALEIESFTYRKKSKSLGDPTLELVCSAHVGLQWGSLHVPLWHRVLIFCHIIIKCRSNKEHRRRVDSIPGSALVHWGLIRLGDLENNNKSGGWKSSLRTLHRSEQHHGLLLLIPQRDCPGTLHLQMHQHASLSHANPFIHCYEAA